MERLGKIHASQWSAAKAYFNDPANVHAVKLSRRLLARLSDIKAKPRLHSFIKINNTLYAMSHQTYLGSGSYGAVKLIQNEAGENFALKIEQIAADANLTHKNIKKQIELKILKKIKDPQNQKYLKGYHERHFEQRESKIKEIEHGKIIPQGNLHIIGKRYTVTSLIPGTDLSQHPEINVLQSDLNPQGYEDNFTCTMPWHKRLQVAIQITRALKLIHERGILHGDFKPSNLMYFENSKGIFIFPIDYGMSYLLKRKGFLGKLTRKKRSTPPLESKICARFYRAPEVIQGNRITKASDLYSLGVILKYDLELPSHVFAALLNENPNDRPSCETIIKTLKSEMVTLNTSSQLIADKINDVIQTFILPKDIETSIVADSNQLHCRFMHLHELRNEHAYHAISHVFAEHDIVFNDESPSDFTIPLYDNHSIFLDPEKAILIKNDIQSRLEKMANVAEFFARIIEAKAHLSILTKSSALSQLISQKDLKEIYRMLVDSRLELEEDMWAMKPHSDLPLPLLLTAQVHAQITYHQQHFNLLIKTKLTHKLPGQWWRIDTIAPIAIQRGLARSPEIFDLTKLGSSLSEIKKPIARTKASFNIAASTACSSSAAPAPRSITKPGTALLFSSLDYSNPDSSYLDPNSSYIETEKENQYQGYSSQSSRLSMS